MKKTYDNIERLVLNRHESKIEFINAMNSKVGEERLYRTKLDIDNASVDVVAKDTRDSMHVNIKFNEPIKCKITRDERGYTVITCEREKIPEPSFEYEEPPSKSRLMRDTEAWG